MKKLNRNEKIAVTVSIVTVALLLYGVSFLNLFNPNPQMNDQVLSEAALPASGVQATDIVSGTGEVAAPGDVVTVNYVGTLTNGEKFDSSYDRGQAFIFPLGVGRVIRGWDEGVQGMRVGGRRRLVIAPDYGYGAQANGAIPANSVLIFEVELLDVQKGAAVSAQ